MDNISFHKSACIQKALEKHGVSVIFIPPYSPQFDPIEEVFSHLKREFREQLLQETSFKLSIDNAIETISQKTYLFQGSYSHTARLCS
jgi:transposase